MRKFIEARGVIESDTAKKLQALCAKPSLTPEGRTLGAGWAATRQNADEQHAARLTFCQILRDLANDLATFRKEIDRQKEQVRNLSILVISLPTNILNCCKK